MGFDCWLRTRNVPLEARTVLGRPVTDWTADHDRERNAVEVRKCQERGSTRNLEIDYVWPDGRVTPCDRIPHETMGSVLESTLEEIWHGEAARRFREMLAVPIGELEECRDCGYLPYCTGGCPVLPMREGGEMLGRDPGGCIRLFLELEEKEVPCG